jgi:ABC-2 type transport system permease protein
MHTLRIHLLEIKYEFLKMLRMPAYALPTLLFPMFFYLFFGVGMGAQKPVGAVKMATYLLATYGTFGVMGASLFGFGVTVAIERGQGWLQVKRTTPMPVSAYFVAKIAMAILFSALVVTGLFTLGVTLGNVHLPFAAAARLFLILIGGALTFCALGLAIGYYAGPNSAAPIVQLVYLPLSFLSGLWMPIWLLPKALQRLAFFLPPFHLSQLALSAVGSNRGGPASVHVIALGIATAIFLAIAYAGFRRDEGKMYG